MRKSLKMNTKGENEKKFVSNFATRLKKYSRRKRNGQFYNNVSKPLIFSYNVKYGTFFQKYTLTQNKKKIHSNRENNTEITQRETLASTARPHSPVPTSHRARP